jgi:predicted nucleic acid-binding protein
MLIDTDVLIWYLRGNKKAARQIEKHTPIQLSAVTYMELVQGMRNKQELQALRRTVKEYRWKVIPLNEDITHRAMIYIEDHFLGHSLRMADALIAATAVEYGLEVLTANDKHYRAVNELTIKIFRA